MKRYLKNKNFLIGFVIVSLIVIMAVLSFVWTPYDPNKMHIRERLKPPSMRHILGTDQYGRDIFSRIMVGAVNSIFVGIVSVGIGLLFGLFFGAFAAYSGGWKDEITMRIMDVLYGFPPVLMAILITSILGPGIRNSILAIGIFNIPVFARLTRGSFLSMKERDFVQAARALGDREFVIIAKHIFPNIISPIIVQSATQFAVAILAEAALSYLGLGTQPPNASWGRMLKEAQTYMRLSPWPAIFPGLAIGIAVMGINMLGDGLRDIFDPRLARLGKK